MVFHPTCLTSRIIAMCTPMQTTIALLVCSLLTGAASGQSAALRDLDTHCPFNPPATLEAWEDRAADLALQVRVSQGLLPYVELDPVQPQIYGKVDKDGYTIEKVIFESLPGFYVTGNLYRPADLEAGQTVPGILCPHGHWNDARFYEASEREIKQLLASGAERHESAARNHIQARCVQLARMGCIVFHWDMIGYCDSQQISLERAHRFAEQPATSEVKEDGWLLFSPLAEMHLQSVLGLQTLATRRAVDMLLTLPEVDADRIAITGASGGGTQSFIGAATDERIQVAFPAVMVSTGMQGGCTCENSCWLRTGTGNVEIASLIAPRPLGLTAADDWTRTMPEDGFPELQKIYQLYDAKDKVALFPAIHFGHNYNHVSRVAMYGWINDHFRLGFEKPVLEKGFDVAERDDLSVWDAEHLQPEGGEEFERKLMKSWAEMIDSQLLGLLRGDAQQISQLAEILDGGWRVTLGLTTGKPAAATPRGADDGEKGLTLTSDSDGKWLLKRAIDDKSPDSGVVRIELGSDASYTFALPELHEQPLVKNPRLSAAYTYGYNLPHFSQQARRLGLTLQWLREQHPNKELTLQASGSAAALAAAGCFCYQQLAEVQEGVMLELSPGEFRFSDVESIRDPNFLPGAARYLDLPGLLASVKSADIRLATPLEDERTDDLSRLIEHNQSRWNIE